MGFAVVYFLDPDQGERRRRRTIEALQDAVLRAMELASSPVEPANAPAARAEAPARSGEDLATSLRDQVGFFRLDAQPPAAEAVPVGVGGPAGDTLEAEALAYHSPERVSYVQAARAPATPRPTIISYDPEPVDDRAWEESAAPPPEAPPPEAVTQAQGSSSRTALVGAAVAAVFLVAAALGAWVVWGGSDASTSAAPALPSGASEAIQLISQPGARSLSVAGSKGAMVLVVTPGGRAALIISGLAAAPPGKEYQAWVVTGKTPKSAGVFKGGGTRLVIPLAQPIPKGSIFAVTVERAGGVPAPTQTPRFTAKLA